ncbi:MAG: hypothetical protein GC160_00285 [Acidobacteria bacterium]|nr:hypothetical protein [Acidobacteriota bacterium]
MADPVITRSITSGVTPKPTQTEGPAKGQSFEQVRQSMAEKMQSTAQMPPEAAAPTAEVKKSLATELHKKLQNSQMKTPQQVFGPEMQDLGGKINGLRVKVEKTPNTPELSPLRTRLEKLESQFSQTGARLEKLTSTNDPRAMLQLQVEVHQMTQNFEIVSKVVEQVNSGVKQIIQTQV